MQISNIRASLSQGNFLDRKQFAILYSGMVALLLLPLLTVVLIIAPYEWDGQMVDAMVGGNFMFISVYAVYISIFVKNNKLRKKIILWLEDAIETKAYSKNIGENRLGFQPKATKIEVKFKVNNKIYTRESTAKVFGGWEGYQGVFTKYADREINILYSEKYDEVLILKDKETSVTI